MKPKHWSHSRRAAYAPNTDPFNAPSLKAPMQLPQASYCARRACCATSNSCVGCPPPRRPPLIIIRPPLPSPQPLLSPAKASAPVSHKRAAYSTEEKAELKRLYRLGGIEHLMPPPEE